MKKTLLVMILILLFALVGCDDLEPYTDDPDNCETDNSCVLTEVTDENALEYFTNFLLEEADSTISSDAHCNKYYTEDIEVCTSSRDFDLALDFSLTLHSFDVYDEENDIYKIGVVYQDNETDEFLEYHLVQFYFDESNVMQFDIEIPDHQYDTEDYADFARSFATDVMSELSAGAICSYYFIEDHQSSCQTEISDIRESFISMEYIDMTYNTAGFYTTTFAYNNGDYDENIASHWNFIVTMESAQLKIMVYGLPLND